MNELNIEQFVNGYLEALAFTLPEDEEYESAMYSPELRKDCDAECREFIKIAEKLLGEAFEYDGSYSHIQAGRDFWFTRNGDGVGFWDRNLGEVGDKLTELTQNKYDPVDAYVGDDGLFYI